ncbi:MAG: GTP cyclohydrolase I FolE [Bacteroidia bacterium]
MKEEEKSATNGDNHDLTQELVDFDGHQSTSVDTPLREGAFELDDEEKMLYIEKHFREIMLLLGLDLTDDSLKHTPKRVAKMYVQEIFSGLSPENRPRITLFDNSFKYGQMLVEKDITFYSTCEHHFLPIRGHAHVAYISTGKVIGLSKIHRIVHYFAKRPQVQERLTRQIACAMKKELDTEDVAVLLQGHHMCVSARGIRDEDSFTVTSEYCGKFKERDVKNEFLTYLK